MKFAPSVQFQALFVKKVQKLNIVTNYISTNKGDIDHQTTNDIIYRLLEFTHLKIYVVQKDN